MQPQIEVALLEGSCKATITVHAPKRIKQHPSFDLVGFKVAVETSSEGVYLDTRKAKFGDASPLVITATLPHQVCGTSGKLMVAAQYSKGRLVFSEPYVVHNMPIYGKADNDWLQ